MLDVVRAVESDTSDTAREIRKSIGALLGAEGEVQQAREVLTTLREDLCLLLGPSHPETQEITEMLHRLDEP